VTFAAVVVDAAEKRDGCLPRHTLRDLDEVVVGVSAAVEPEELVELQAEHDDEVVEEEHVDVVELAFDCHPG